jgi:tetratricopeptide (TPR) repeat protein
MTNDDKLTEAIQLIKAGQKNAARAALEPFLLKNPNHIQAWMWETELFSSDRDKIKVLEACLKQNPGNPQVRQALAFFKKRAGFDQPPVVPTPAPSAYSPPPPVYPESGPASYRAPAPVKPVSPVSPFSTPLDWSDDSEDSLAALRPTATESHFVESSQPVEAPRSKPVSPKKAAPKKPLRISSKLLNAILVILGCLACLVAIGFYVGGGYYLNGQINQAFAEQNCEAVVQQASFVSLYPQGIFGSTFSGYDQYDECRIKLGVEQAAAAKNWGEALALSQQYLATYPDGPFAKSLGEQAPTFLSTWSDELIASHNFASGIEKLKQLLEAHPDSPPAQTAPETILQAYLFWARELTDKQSYKDAEYPLQSALIYFQADPGRSGQIKQELANLYLGWGNQQVQLGDIDNAIITYQKAGDIFPGQIDVALLVARAHLQKAISISKVNNFDKALDRVQEVSDTAQTENIKAEANTAREEILTAYAFSTSPQAMERLTAAIPLMCQGQRPELPIFGRDTEKIRFGLTNTLVKLPADWVAEKPGELHYVICPTETEQEIETCKYTGGYFLTRMRYVWQVTLYDLLTGEVSAKATLKGADPDGCPPRANFLVGSKVSRSYGQRPTADQIVAWLTKLKLTK